jgi:dTDP-4-amino-4,6-dideoxygalactose transaminase
MTPIPLVDLGRQHRALHAELQAAMARVLDATAFINGPDVKAFEDEFAAYCGTRHCVGVSSGLEALRLALIAVGVGPGDEVILPANTFIATALAVSGIGARPVLVDCDPATANILPDAIAAAITPRTKALLPVHLYGQPVDWDAIAAVADAHGLPVVEDAAQAHGARHRGRRCGSLGRAAAFSFYPGKNLGAFGDGGALTTDDDGVADYVRQARDYGQRRKYEHVIKGGNWRLDTLQAAVLRVKLRYLDEWNATRRQLADAYGARLQDATDVKLPAVRTDVEPVWHLYVIEVSDRDALLGKMQRLGIGAGIHYPTPIHLQPAYSDLGYARGDFPNAERQSARVLSLPLFPEMTLDEIHRVVTAIVDPSRNRQPDAPS